MAAAMKSFSRKERTRQMRYGASSRPSLRPSSRWRIRAALSERSMSWALGIQVVAAIAGAWIGVVGLDKGDLNALAFGVLVPMFGVGMNGVWASRHGAYGPRIGKAVSPTDHKID